VLVAEDDASLGEVLARGLRDQGYVVDLVPDGETAATYLRFYRYEVAVLDWRMPRLSGLDLVQRLRRGATANGSTPVLMLTARDTPADRITGLDAGRTTTWSSRSTSASCWPGSGRCSAGRRSASRPG
jgi:DNA-binding response OmpR family regulator